MSGTAGNLALDGGDPRGDGIAGLGSKAGHDVDIAPSWSQVQKSHDSSVTFEEYLHFARISRADARYEDQDFSLSLFGKGKPIDAVPAIDSQHSTEKISDEKTPIEKNISVSGDSSHRDTSPVYTPAYERATDEDYVTASRAARNATWGAVFYLITTDILGPYSTP